MAWLFRAGLGRAVLGRAGLEWEPLGATGSVAGAWGGGRQGTDIATATHTGCNKTQTHTGGQYT